MSIRFSLLIILAAATVPATAEDIVFVRGKPPQEHVQKRGEITQWIGGQLYLRGALMREEIVADDRILKVQSEWSAAQQAAERLLAKHQLDDAIKAFYEAKQDETREWAVRRISADLTVALLESGRPNLAGTEFLSIVAVDPATHLLDAAPIAWRGGNTDDSLLAQAAKWSSSENATARLLGASWLLNTPQRRQAVAALEGLRTDSDRRLAAAAEIQLWRTRIVSTRPEEVARWKLAASKIPAELRGCAWFQIGEVLARLNQPEEAALAYLQTALTYNRQRAMAADAIVAAASQLEKLGRKRQAATLYREAQADYRYTPASDAAQARLELLAKP